MRCVTPATLLTKSKEQNEKKRTIERKKGKERKIFAPCRCLDKKHKALPLDMHNTKQAAVDGAGVSLIGTISHGLRQKIYSLKIPW